MAPEKQISAKQIEANRRNARLSTRPRTAEGRAVSRLNAYKHGLTGHLDVMTDDQKHARDTFIAEIVGDLRAVGPLECQLAHSIAVTQWRISRVAVIENNIFVVDAWYQERDRLAEHAAPAEEVPSAADIKPDSELDAALASAHTCLSHPESFNLLTVYEMRLCRKFQNELRQFQALQSARANEAARQQAEAERQKAAEEKQKAEAETRRAAALQEAAWILNLDEEEGKTIQPDGVFRHRNGFIFSNSLIQERIAWTARLTASKALFTCQLNDIKYDAEYPNAGLEIPGPPGLRN